MTMQFGRDERTGQLGYWDGQKFVPLEKTTIKQAAQGATGMQFENISPQDRATVEKQMQVVAPNVPQVGAPLPGQRAAELAKTGEVASAAAQDPQYLAETQQAGNDSLPELIKFAVANVAPAVMSGGATALGAAAVKGGGLLARLTRMAAGGAGGYAGEKINQATGLSEGDESTAMLSGGIGALPGFFKPKVASLTADERKIQRLTAGAEVGAKGEAAKGTGEALYGLARTGVDISSERLLKPLDDLMTQVKTTPNIGNTKEGEAFLAKLEALRSTLVKRVLELKTSTTPGKPGQPIPPGPIEGVPVSVESGVPAKRPGTVGMSKSDKEVSPTLTTPFDWLFNKAKGVVSEGGNAPTQQAMTPGTPPKTRVTGLKVVEEPRQVNPENLVDDLKQLTNQKGLYREAENLGIPGLTQKLKVTYRAMADEVKYLPEADVIYGQGKALERGAKATRTGGAVGVENLLADPKLSGGLTTAQKAFLREQAAKSDKIGVITQSLLQSPLGRSMLRLGVSEKGVVKPAAWSAALQIGARMAGLGQQNQ